MLPRNLVVIDESLFSLSTKYTMMDETLVTSIVTTEGESGGPTNQKTSYVTQNLLSSSLLLMTLISSGRNKLYQIMDKNCSKAILNKINNSHIFYNSVTFDILNLLYNVRIKLNKYTF